MATSQDPICELGRKLHPASSQTELHGKAIGERQSPLPQHPPRWLYLQGTERPKPFR